MGKKLASGGFGTVYRGSLRDPEGGATRDVIIKKAKEFGEAEVCVCVCVSVGGWEAALPSRGATGLALFRCTAVRHPVSCAMLLAPRAQPLVCTPYRRGMTCCKGKAVGRPALWRQNPGRARVAPFLTPRPPPRPSWRPGRPG